ncbi:hypothetical protein ABH920_006370 [Catenulispora sp. EB89]|uniref:hypothetical protein n=1 Tax=Catenulispora sp. EB89 TaxID=3156257 RepID=UPI0035140755
MPDEAMANLLRTTEGADRNNPVRVVSLVLFRDDTRQEVLLGVRRNVPSMPRHPGVLSTPTARVPEPLFAILAHEACPRLTEVGIKPRSAGRSFRLGTGDVSRHPAAFVLESLVARKVGIADALVGQRFEAVATLAATALDLVEDPLGTETAEWTEMLTYEAVVTAGAKEIPESTQAYTRLIWARHDLVVRAMNAGDALIVDDSLNPFEVCIGGLCIRSAIPLLER